MNKFLSKSVYNVLQAFYRTTYPATYNEEIFYLLDVIETKLNGLRFGKYASLKKICKDFLKINDATDKKISLNCLPSVSLPKIKFMKKQ